MGAYFLGNVLLLSFVMQQATHAICKPNILKGVIGRGLVLLINATLCRIGKDGRKICIFPNLLLSHSCRVSPIFLSVTFVRSYALTNKYDYAS